MLFQRLVVSHTNLAELRVNLNRLLSLLSIVGPIDTSIPSRLLFWIAPTLSCTNLMCALPLRDTFVKKVPSSMAIMHCLSIEYASNTPIDLSYIELSATDDNLLFRLSDISEFDSSALDVMLTLFTNGFFFFILVDECSLECNCLK